MVGVSLLIHGHAWVIYCILSPSGATPEGNAQMCVCWGSENAPILKDAFGKKICAIFKGSYAHFIPILW